MLREALSAAIVVPTRHESGNVVQLYHELDDTLGDRKWRLVFVDDSRQPLDDLAQPSKIKDRPARDQEYSRLMQPGGRASF